MRKYPSARLFQACVNIGRRVHKVRFELQVSPSLPQDNSADLIGLLVRGIPCSCTERRKSSHRIASVNYDTHEDMCVRFQTVQMRFSVRVAGRGGRADL